MVEVLRAAEAKIKAGRGRDAPGDRRRRNELLGDATSPVGGNPEGDVTIVEFFDYRCPYCKQVEPALEALVKEDRQDPHRLQGISGSRAGSVYASRMALAAESRTNTTRSTPR